MVNSTLYIAKLRSVCEHNETADGKIASCLLLNLKNLNNLSINNISEKTNTSYATVCRFFKKIGFIGIKECRQLLAGELEKSGITDIDSLDFSIEMPPNSTYEQISSNVCSFSASIVESCKRVYNEKLIEHIANLICNANNIYFVGLGTSAVMAHYAYAKFFRLNPNCSFDSDIIITKMKSTLLKKGSVLFAISSSGRTKAICECAYAARNNGASVISMCDYMNSPLVNLSDVSICTTVRDVNKYIDLDYPLIQGQVTLIDILYSYIFNRTHNAASQNITRTADSVNEYKLK